MRTAQDQMGIAALRRLGADVSDAPTDDELRVAYRQLLRRSHPDMHPHASTSQREALSRQLRAIVAAWELLPRRSEAAA